MDGDQTTWNGINGAAESAPTFKAAGPSAASLAADNANDEELRPRDAPRTPASTNVVPDDCPDGQAVLDGIPNCTPPWAPHTFVNGAGNNVNDPTEVYINGSYRWYTGMNGIVNYETPDDRPHNVEYMPEDWGMEFDYNLYNDDLPGGNTRPACPFGNDRQFWGARGTNSGDEVRSWEVWVGGSTTVSAGTWGAYFDGNDASDDCSSLGLSVGVGYPRNLNDGLTGPDAGVIRVYTTVVADRGAKVSSVQSASYQATSNDCNNVGVEPNSNCMGLNVNRAFPGPGSDRHISVGKTAGYTAPGVLYSYSGWDGPLDYAPF